MNREQVGSTGRAAAARAVKVAAAAVDVLRPPRRGVVVLLYHRVGRRSTVAVDLPLDLFRQQMEMLAEQHRVVTLDDALAALVQPAPPPENLVAVTFDDGTADFVDIAFPVLERCGIPVTLYAATDFLERGLPFPNDGAPASWAAIRDLVATDLLTVGSHTHTHRLLDRIDSSDVADELDRSVALIEEQLGVPPAHFAYPKAVLGSPPAQTAVRKRFRSAAVAGTRVNPHLATDPYRLARSPVQLSDGMTWFRHKVGGGMALEDSLRRVANRNRYAGLST